MKNTWPESWHSFDIPVYGGIFWLTKSKEEFNQAEKFLCPTEEVSCLSGGRSTMFENTNGSVCYVVGVFDNSKSTLTHELAHSAFFILERAGVPVGQDKVNEAYCYLLGFLLKRCLEVYPDIYKTLKRD